MINPLNKLMISQPPSKADLINLLEARGELQQTLFALARQIRREQGVDAVTMRGVIEISNVCQKNCEYCAMRASNQELPRTRMSAETILAIADKINQTGIPILFLQAAQDPLCDPILEEVIPEVKKRYDMSILLCLGKKKREVYEKFAKLGADSYILKFETSSPTLYRHIAYTPLEKRIQCLRWLQELGYKVGTGNIVGLPEQTIENLAEDILKVWELRTDFASSSPFIPNPGTPLSHLGYGDLNLTLNTMAIYRILLKDILIPTISALEKIQPGGQLMGLNAGANVITVNFTPKAQQENYVIYSDQRFVVSWEHAKKIISQAGLTLKSSEILAYTA
jgi:biotin synthase